jgi:hypothetical protein
MNILTNKLISKSTNLELMFWISSLVYLSVINPNSNSNYSFCIYKFLGFKWCPGCGIGKSISFLIHGNISESFKSHWFGFFALLIILKRIIGILKK